MRCSSLHAPSHVAYQIRISAGVRMSKRRSVCTAGAAVGFVASLGVLVAVTVYCFLEITGRPTYSQFKVPPKHPSNAQNRSVYFGNGCFWHTQYDTTMVEMDGLNRSAAQVTSLAGYGGDPPHCCDTLCRLLHPRRCVCLSNAVYVCAPRR
jgi:hypothetical protein